MNSKNIDVILIGCANYLSPYSNLPFVSNDIDKIRQSLIDGLNINASNIMLYKDLTGESIDNIFKYFEKYASKEKMLIFYFSGHGNKPKRKGSSIVLSDNSPILINDLIKKIDLLKYKNKWFIFDSCYSGQVFLEETEVKIGEGDIVTCSSSKDEKSFANDDYTLSYFTEILCNALTFSNIFENESKSLSDIINLIRVIYNNKKSKQTLINKQNFIGSIYFGNNSNIDLHNKSKVFKYSFNNGKFSTIGFEPIHTLSTKKYCFHIISDVECESTLNEIACEVFNISNEVECYKNDKYKLILSNKKVDLLWIYVYPDEFNYSINNPKYILEFHNEKDIVIKKQLNFEFILQNRLVNTIDDSILYEEIGECYNKSLIELKELYRILEEIDNKNWTEKSSYSIYIKSKERINIIYNTFLNIKFGSTKTDLIYNLFLEYFNNIKELLMFMNEQGKNKWNDDRTRYFLINKTKKEINKILNYIKELN